jgi:hypothetical protein
MDRPMLLRILVSKGQNIGHYFLYIYIRWFKYDRDDLCVNKSQFVPVIFEPPCTFVMHSFHQGSNYNGVRVVRFTKSKSQLLRVQCSCIETFIINQELFLMGRLKIGFITY